MIICKNLGNLSVNDFLNFVQLKFSIREFSEKENVAPQSLHYISMFFNDKWYEMRPYDYEDLLLLRSSSNSIHSNLNQVNLLDAQILFNYLLQPILGIAEVRTDRRVYYVRGNMGRKGLEAEVISGRARVAFYLKEITTHDIMSVADAGLLLPPKVGSLIIFSSFTFVVFLLFILYLDKLV